MSNNPSFVLQGIESVVFEERPIPHIRDDEALIEVKKTGICGSDVHFLVHGRIGHYVVEKPMVLGHESSGIVSQVGPGVKHLKPGDRVAMEPGATCRVCNACKSGRYQLCPNIIFAATPPNDGTLARYYAIPADLCYKLPDHLTLEDGALIEPLSVGVHSVHSIGALRAGQNVVIFGAGPVGLLCMAVAKALGASRVIAVDIIQSRLEFAKNYAATDIYLPPAPNEGESKIQFSERNASIMREKLSITDRGSGSIDLVVDASGAEVSIQTGMYIVRHGGTFVQVGMGTAEIAFPIITMLTKEVTFKGAFRYGPGDYQLSVSLVSLGRIDLKPLVTHRYTFEQAAEAFATNRAGKSANGRGVIKAIISGPDVSVDNY